MLLLSTSSLKWYWIHKIFTIVKKSKYDGIDLVIDEKNYDTLDEKYLKWLSDAFEVPVLSITAPDRGLSKSKIDQIVKIAEALKTQVINFYPPHISDKAMPSFPKYLNKLKKDLRISITLQNVEQKFMLFVIPEYKNSNLVELKKITWDTALNIANLDKASGIDILKAQNMLGSSLKNIYLSDKQWIKDGLLPGTAGWGVSSLPIESFMMKLKSSWYNWFFSLRVKPTELWIWDEEKVLYNLDLVQKYFKKHFLDYKVD